MKPNTTIELEKELRIAFPMGILDFAIDTSNQTVFAACMDGIYQCPPSHVPVRIGEHTSYVSGVVLSSSRRTLVSTSYDGTLHIRDITHPATNELLQPRISKKIHSFWSWRMAMSPNEKWVVSVTGQYLAGSEDYTPLPSSEPCLKIANAETGEIAHALEMLPSVQCVAIDATSQWVVAGNLMGDMAVWEIETGKKVAEWRTPSFTSWGIIKSHCYIGGIYAVAFSPDSQFVYAAGMGEMTDPMAGNGKQRWQQFAWREAPVKKQLESKNDQTGEGLMECLAWHPSGEYFAMSGRLRGGNWNVGLFSALTGELIGQTKTDTRVTKAIFSLDGESLLLGGMKNQAAPKDGIFPDFGTLDHYRLKSKSIS